MPAKRFYVQPAWVDFSIFWALIVSGTAFAVIVQMETGGYDYPNYWALLILAVVWAIGLVQVLVSRMIFQPEKLLLTRLGFSMHLEVNYNQIKHAAIIGHQIQIQTQKLGNLNLVKLGNTAKLAAEFSAHNVKVTTQKGVSSHV